MAPSDLASDTGLQPERTSLSWTRTSIALMANALLVGGRDLLAEPGSAHPATAALAAVTLLTALVVYVIGRHRARTLAASHPRHTRTPAAITATGVSVVLLCVTLLASSIL